MLLKFEQKTTNCIRICKLLTTRTIEYLNNQLLLQVRAFQLVWPTINWGCLQKNFYKARKTNLFDFLIFFYLISSLWSFDLQFCYVYNYLTINHESIERKRCKNTLSIVICPVICNFVTKYFKSFKIQPKSLSDWT